MSALWRAFASCVPSSSTQKALDPNSLALPNELWTEIFLLLDARDVLRVSRVNRTFNALAIPIYLGHFGIEHAELHAGRLHIPVQHSSLLATLRTAFFIPKITSLSCTLPMRGRYDMMRYLARSLADSVLSSGRIRIEFEEKGAFEGYKSKRGRYGQFFLKARPHMQQGTELLLNSLMPRCRIIAIMGHSGRTILLDATSATRPARRWQLVRQPMPPPLPGFFPHLRYALHLRSGRPPVVRDLTLFATFTSEKLATRITEPVDDLRSIDVQYALGATHDTPRPWSLLLLNAGMTKKYKLPASIFSLVPGANLTWADILSALAFPALEDLQITPFCSTSDSGGVSLHEVPLVDLDAFLLRHPTIEALDYLPQLPESGLSPPPPPDLHFSALTHLTTSAFHFIHAFQDPHCAPSLVEVRLLDVVERGTDSDAVVAVLRILDGRRGNELMRLSMPITWAGLLLTDDICEEPVASLLISCVNTLHLFALRPVVEGPKNDIAPIISPVLALLNHFNRAVLRNVELQPTLRVPQSVFLRQVNDAIRCRAPWLADVACVREGQTKWLVDRETKEGSKRTRRIRIPSVLRRSRADKDKARTRRKADDVAINWEEEDSGP